MNIFGMSPEAKLISIAIVLALDIFLVKTWKWTMKLPTILEYTPKQREWLNKSAWFCAWIVAIIITIKYF